jgi:ssDNA thymidine ADP-ribosyltransferase, DarT
LRLFNLVVIVNRSDLEDLCYITPIANVPSIILKGIVSHRAAQQFAHKSVAMAEIQDKRSTKRVPGGRPLHEYVNLYMSARNPMMYKRRVQHEELCVLRISTDVLDLPGVIVADGNAASDYTGFWPAPGGLAKVNRALTFAESWTSPDVIDQYRRASAKCAEILVPDRVESKYILGAYVSSVSSSERFRSVCATLPRTILPTLFFR